MKSIIILLTTFLVHNRRSIAPAAGLAEIDYQGISLARRVADMHDSVEVVAVYAGVGNGGLKLRRALAAGADRAISLEFAETGAVDSLYVCKVLQEKLITKDVVLVIASDFSPLAAVVVNPLQFSGLLGWRVRRALLPVGELQLGAFAEPQVMILRTVSYPAAELLAFSKPSPVELLEAAGKPIDVEEIHCSKTERSVIFCSVEAEVKKPCRFFTATADSIAEFVAELVAHCPLVRKV